MCPVFSASSSLCSADESGLLQLPIVITIHCCLYDFHSFEFHPNFITAATVNNPETAYHWRMFQILFLKVSARILKSTQNFPSLDPPMHLSSVPPSFILKHISHYRRKAWIGGQWAWIPPNLTPHLANQKLSAVTTSTASTGFSVTEHSFCTDVGIVQRLRFTEQRWLQQAIPALLYVPNMLRSATFLIAGWSYYLAIANWDSESG